MDREWNESQPIYRQLRDRVVAMILDGVLKEGMHCHRCATSRPNTESIRSQVLKGYQQLVDEGLVESKRGLGMFINAGARNQLLEGERRSSLSKNGPGSTNDFSGSASR